MSMLQVKPSELAEARAKLYQLLNAVYIRPPEPDFLKLLAGWVASQVETDGPSQWLSEPIRHSLSSLHSFFGKESRYEELAGELSVEFTRLFRGVKQHYSPPPPYESVYREEGGRVFGQLSTEVQQEYRRFGLDLVSEVNGEPPDHLSFELEFLHLLCGQEAGAWERNDDDEALRLLWAEKCFLEEHLLTWLPKVCEKIREFDRLGFFRCLADLTEGWVIFDYHEHLKGLQ